MKITYDSASDATYVKLSDNKISHTIDYCNYYIDIDYNGGIVGIEYLHAPTFELDGIELNMELIKAEMLNEK